MMNGPMGGFMGTPPAPSQPPQVNFTTTAESRGGFSNFLKSIPNTTAMTPLPPMGSSPMPPMGGNPMGNIDIFNQPPSTGMGMMGMNQPQMNPMMQQPMNMGVGLMGKPIQNFFDGGGVDDSDFGGFSDYGSVDASSDNNDNNDFSFSDDTVGDTSAGDFTVGDTEDRSQSDAYQSALDNITLGSDDSMFSNDPASATPMGLSYPSAQNFGNRPTINANDLNLLKSEINNRNEISLTEEDSFFNKDGSMKQSGIDELNKRNAADLQLVQAGDIPVSNYISSGSVLDNLDLSKDLALDKVPDRQGPPQFNEFSRTPARTVTRDGRGVESVFGELDFPGSKNDRDFNKTVVAGTNLSPEQFSRSKDFARDQLSNVDVFENIIDRNFQNTGLAGANLPTIGSARSTVAEDQAKALANLVGDRDQTIGEKLQQNILEERGRALGPTTFRDDAADVTFENIRGQTPTTDTVFDIDTTDTRNFVGDDFAPALTLSDRNEADRLAAGQAMGVGTPPLDATNITETALGGRSQNATTSTVPEDFEENVGRKFDADRMADIERLYGEDIGQTKAGRGQDPTFFEGKGFTGTAGGILDAIERKSRENMANEIALGRPMGLGETFFGYKSPDLRTQTMEDYMANTQKNILNEAGDSETVSRRLPENQLIRNDSGRVIGIKNASGRLVSGMDPNAPIDRGDDNDSNPFIRRLPLVKTVADVEEDKTPNVFGGGQTTTTKPKSVVVDSPFTTNVGDYSPTGFDSGDLNALIAQLLKTSNPKSMAQGGVAEYAGGGLISAVDNFLASV